MKGDFSRVTFDPVRHFSRVLMQQGRVTLDADHNEQAAIGLHLLRTLTRDLFGPYGAPAGSTGFSLVPQQIAGSNGYALSIGAGHYYVDGILCENDGCTYASQPDYSPVAGTGGDALLNWLANPVLGPVFWVYLDVWERHITWIEDDRIREVALGGPDTCTRAKVVWQVKALPWDPNWETGVCAAPLASLVTLSDAQLAAQLDPGLQLGDPCVIPPDSKYRGAENQLYRVEIHRGGSIGDKPTFKWSRDNGSVATPWQATDGNDLVVSSARGFDAGTWVELSSDANDLSGTPGLLVKLAAVSGGRLSVDPASLSGSLPTPDPASLHPKVRRWDQSANDVTTLVNGAVPIRESASSTTAVPADWIDLEDGVQIRFAPNGSYRTGDYWLIPARVATGALEWPTHLDAQKIAVADLRPPRGIRHHYAPLGILQTFSAAGGMGVSDCRVCVQLLQADCSTQPVGPSPAPSPSPAPGAAGAVVRGAPAVRPAAARAQPARPAPKGRAG